MRCMNILCRVFERLQRKNNMKMKEILSECEMVSFLFDVL